MTLYPNDCIFSVRPAMRRADGPMSTPLLPEPRSIGKPMICTVLSMITTFILNNVVTITASGIYGKRLNPQNQRKNLSTFSIFHDDIG
jgi:hypothetical protein